MPEERFARRPPIEVTPTSRGDLPELMALWNDGRVTTWVGFPQGLGYTEERIARWFSRVSEDPDRHHFIARSPEAGFCGELYYAVDRAHGRAGLDIKFRPEARGGRRSLEALKSLIRSVFENEPEVDVVWTEPSLPNLSARTLYWACGLRPAERPSDMEPYESFWALTRSEFEKPAWPDRSD